MEKKSSMDVKPCSHHHHRRHHHHHYHILHNCPLHSYMLQQVRSHVFPPFYRKLSCLYIVKIKLLRQQACTTMSTFHSFIAAKYSSFIAGRFGCADF
ncbi:SKI/DACH domain-containing protein 1 [Capsicum galapagoense]